MLLKTFLVFWGYLALFFGWVYYGVVFVSFMAALFTYLKNKDTLAAAKFYVRSLTTLGAIDLFAASIFALFKTALWLLSGAPGSVAI